MKANLKFARPLAAALGLIAFAGVPAFAADVVSEEPPAPAPVAELPVASWAGPYAGINLGYGFSGRTRIPGGPDIKTDGFIGGAFAGYNWQSDNFVYGLEGDLGYNGVKGSSNGFKSKSGFEGSIRARLGYAVTPEILLYGTAGGAGKNVKVTNDLGDSQSKGMFGWTAGVGTDIKLTDNVFGRVEYRYTDYGSKSFDNVGGKVKERDNRVTFGIGMKF